jgi:hypothetical protein
MSDEFDRKRPLYRLFEVPDGSREWWTVEITNMPGRRLTADESALIQSVVDEAPWRDGFYTAFETHRKATFYDRKHDA